MKCSSNSFNTFDRDIRFAKIVYTMKKQDNKKKVLPIKLDSQVYRDLKLLSKELAVPMADIIREHFVESVQKQALAIRAKNKLSLADHAEKYAFQGKMLHPNQTDDELIYLNSSRDEK